MYEKQSDLCNSLGREPRILKDNPLPSYDEVKEFKKYIEKLETEKYSRLKKFFSVKEDLLKIITEINIKPASQFEKSVFSHDSEFLVTNENMEKLEFLHRRLIKQRNHIKEEITRLRNKINDYWNLLDVDRTEREVFQQKYVGDSLDVLHALQDETKRCENLKKANMKVLIIFILSLVNGFLSWYNNKYKLDKPSYLNFT